jgi:hypothetical protein
MQIKLPRQRLEAQFTAAEADRDNRVVPMVFYSGAPVVQFTFERGVHNLTLSTDPKAVRLGRINGPKGAAFTKGHASPNDPDAVIGNVRNARVSGNECRADVRFSANHPDAARLFADVVDGVLTAVSVEATLHRLRETTKENEKTRSFFAEDWEPTAVALVAQGADQGAHLNASDQVELSECEIELSRATSPNGEGLMSEVTNTTGTVQAPGTITTNPDAEAIRKVATVCKLAAFGEDLIARGTGINEARTMLVDRMAADPNNQIRHVHAGVIRDQREGMTAAMAEALACRYTGKAPSEQAREYMGATIAELARVCCEAEGVHASGFGGERFIKLAMHSTSDFPHLLEDTGRRMLLEAYTAARPAIQRIARRSTAADFRTKSALRLGGAPTLVKVPENGEITYGTRAEAKESYRIYTFARLFSITREALVNDDLGAFADFGRAYGIAAANVEGQELVDLLYGAAGVGPDMNDTKALFHTDHSNLALAPAAISGTTFTAARLALRTATDVDGVTIIETAPRYLVVPAELETTAETYLATLYPAQATDVNPFSGKFELIVVPQLGAKSITAWWIFGDPAVVPALEYSYLSGAEGVQVDSRAGFEVLGMEFRAVLDYGVGAIGWRGCYKGNN